MKVIGLTGGIGSGKTTVVKMFQELGITVYIADIEAKKLMNTSLEIRAQLIKNFGEQSFLNNQLNTSYLGEIVFSDPMKLKILNRIVHPKVRNHFEMFKNNQKGSYILFENAILFENGFDNLCDYIITVTTPLEERVKRVQLRDGLGEKQILDRVQHQWTDEQKVKKSDFVINNMDIVATKKRVFEIHSQLLKFIEINKN